MDKTSSPTTNAASATQLAKTFTEQSFPWGLYHRTGHRLLCSDGKVRAAELAQTRRWGLSLVLTCFLLIFTTLKIVHTSSAAALSLLYGGVVGG